MRLLSCVGAHGSSTLASGAHVRANGVSGCSRAACSRRHGRSRLLR